MAAFKINLAGIDELETELQRLSDVSLDAVQTKQLTQMLNRARNRGGAHGTPVDTGELRASSKADLAEKEVGYTAEYAPHVEYGHRTVNGGYVEGQRFLQANVDRQREIYKTDLRRAIRGERNGGD